jgi:predicted aldo/keto reductase-like oxidoreductase
MTETSDFLRTTLGRTGRSIHRLGVASSFGVGGADLEAAVEEHGVNYLYWGSLRTASYGQAIRNLCRRGLRDQLFVVIQSYSRAGTLVKPSLCWALRRLGLERADMLLLGMWNGGVWRRVLDAAVRCQDQGLVSHLGVSTHSRPQAARFAGPGSPFDVVHLRYNAAHRGAEQDCFPLLPPHAERAGTVAFTATGRRKLLKRPRNAPPDLRVMSAGDCYRFVLQRDEIDVCMTGPRHGQDLRDALAAVARGPMDPDELAWAQRVGDLAY